MGNCCGCLARKPATTQDQEPTPSTADHVSADAARAAIDHGPSEKKLKTVAGSSNGVMAQQGDALLESENNDVIMNNVENMVRVRTEAVEEEENNSGRLEQPVAGASSFGGLVDNTMCHAPGRSVEDSIDNGTGGVAQPGAEASSSGGLRHNPSETRWSYDVFLSFRGEDTRKNFTDHLYTALKQAGINTFKDNDHPKGEEISPQLLRAIEGSRISVVVFSRNYASSRWCLDELVKIMECRQKTYQVVLPIFYYTDPSDVRKQTGSYAKAFDEHEEHFKEEMEKVNRWREALTQAADLSGRVLHNETNGYEAEFIKRVVSDVACRLGNKTLHVAKHDAENSGRLVQPGAGVPLPTSSMKPVGRAFEENKKQIWSLLMDDEVPTIGIYGMGGVGKTTILQHIHNELLQRPDICDHVWWVTMSQDFTINRLQNLIAKRLDRDLSSEDDDLHRAARLSEELRKKQKWILILDDLWHNFELHEVGIPIPLKGCKLILTTRSRMVCDQIDCQYKIEVKPLFEGESWTLFKENLGCHIALSDEVEGIAKAVARECAGLPLGIITVASSFRGVNDPREWRNTMKKLKDSVIRDMKVFKLLRFSYDRLRDKALEKCLLYCALFPEDDMIEREELIGYLIDEGIIEGMGRRQDAFDEGHTMLNRLQNVCLLESDKTEVGVKMHDLIRDMAIQIMQENSQVIVKAGAQLVELPDAEEWTETLTRVSLMENRFEEISSSHSPVCPDLSTLFLRGNGKLRFIADSFFKQLHGLKVLDLSRTGIKNLPDSVSDLVTLTALLLKDCRMLRNVPSLKKLRALKRLDLWYTNLEKMPQGMECLTNLRYLRMSGCGEIEFPSGILPKLSHLQVFVLDEGRNRRRVPITVKGPNRRHIPITVKGKEVGSLRNLETLVCQFKGLSDFMEYHGCWNGIRSLCTYQILIGWMENLWINRDLNYPLFSISKTVVLGNLSINRERDFQVKLLNDIQRLVCERIDARSLCDVLSLENATELEIIKFIDCYSMESLVSSSWFSSAPSCKLIFSSLREFVCYGCRNMKNMFPLVLLPNLVNLESIRVTDCVKMEEIVGERRSDEGSSEFKLPNLRHVELSKLPELKSICSGKLICNSLERIVVADCGKMEELIGGRRSDEEGVMGEKSSTEFKLLNLRNMELKRLPELKRICSAKLICDSLERIVVADCGKMEELIGGRRSDEEGVMGEKSSTEFKLLNLRHVELSKLPELKSICNGKLICDSLEWIVVADCAKMEELIGGRRSDEEGVMGEKSSTEFKLLNLRHVELSKLPELKSICSGKLICDSLERIVVADCATLEELIGGRRSDEGVMGEKSSIEFKLLNLRHVELSKLPELKSICSGKLICDSLERIVVADCGKMEELIGGRRSDEEGVMGEKSSTEFKLLNLRHVELSKLPELKSICSGKLICDSLERIVVADCAKMEELIGGRRSDEEGVMGEKSSTEFKLLNLRHVELRELPELKSICSGKLICDSLERIEVADCAKLEELIGGRRSDEEGVMGGKSSTESKLPNLRHVELRKLPELKSIGSGKLICDSLEIIVVGHCAKMEELIGGTRTDEEGVIGEESKEFKFPKLKSLRLFHLPELKSICSANLICDSLERIDVHKCEKLKRMSICLPLLENGQPSLPASLKWITAYPKEWWERVVEWEHPNAKEVLRPILHF